MTRRLVLFAHHDPDDDVAPYVRVHLDALRALAARVVLVTTAPLSPRTAASLLGPCDHVRLRGNAGYDFAGWAEALAAEDLDAFDEVVLTNSSVVGPLRLLQEVFDEMDRRDVDWWGLVEAPSPARHVQSWFLVFRRAAHRHPAFARFFRSVLPYRDKAQVVLSYELGLTKFLDENGLRRGALLPHDEVRRRAPSLYPRGNPTYHLAAELLELGLPYVKVEALRGVAFGRDSTLRRLGESVRARLLRRAIEAKGYDPALLPAVGRALPPLLR